MDFFDEFIVPINTIKSWNESLKLVSELINVSAITLAKTDDIYFKNIVSYINEDYFVNEHIFSCGNIIKADKHFISKVINTKSKIHLSKTLIGKRNYSDSVIGIKAYMGIPIEIEKDVFFGVLSIFDSKDKIFSENNEKILLQLKKSIESALYLIFRNINHSENTNKPVKQSIPNILPISNSKYYSSLPHLILYLDKNGYCVECKEPTDFNVINLFGDCVGREIFNIFPIEIAHKVNKYIYEALKTKETQIFTFKYRSDNTNYYYSTNISYVSDSGVLAIIQDITHTKHIEKQLLISAATTKHSLSMIMIVNTDCEIEYINPKFTRVTGYTPCEVLGKNPRFLKSGEHSLDFYKNMWTTVLSGREWKGELKNKKKNGDLYWEYASIVAVKDETGKVIRFISCKDDISKLKKLKVELTLANDRVGQANKLKTAFMSNMSHEIRTPMNAIIGFADLLKVSNITDKQRDKFVDIINHNANILLSLIDDIIDIAKIESGHIKILKSATHINKILDELYSYFDNDKEKGGKEIQLFVNKANNDDKFTVFSDALRLKQILSNLIGNAIKFTDKGSIQFGYQIKKNIEDETSEIIEFYVKDTGIGIMKEKQKVIFERFGQIEHSLRKTEKRTGFGLPISKKLVDLLGGKIWVESKAGLGSTFYFTLPFNSKYVFTTVSSQRTEVSKGDYNWKEKVILIAEDEDSNCMFFQEALRKTQVQILWAKNGREAVNICKHVLKNKKIIDLILMDIKMPILDGYSATKEIIELFSQNNKSHPPIVAQTAFTLPEQKQNSYNAGCDDILSKPIKSKELMEVIKKYVEKQ